MTAFFRKLSWLLRRRDKEAELQEELQFHLEEEAEQHRAEGLDSAAASHAAKRELGNLTLVQENTRSAWGWTMLEQFAQDLRYALRTMSANKAFCALAILSLALGIGANTAIFSFMDSILMRSLPVADPASLVVLNWHKQGRSNRGSVVKSGSGSMHEENGGTTAGIFPYPAFELLKKSSGAVFSSVFAYYPTREVNLMVRGQAEQVEGEYVSGEYFRGLEVLPSAGRAIVPDDDRVGASPVAVLSLAYAQKRFGDAASATGQPILINNIPFTVAGVAPLGFFGVDPAMAPDFYVPLHTNLLLSTGERAESKSYLEQNYYWIEMMARLQPGAGVAQAQASLAPVFHQWVASTASNDEERVDLPALSIRPGAAGLDNLRREYSKPLYVLLTMVVLVLAIACANIANLLLARATARRREMAVRLSMGAGRFRVIRQLLTESVLLASIGGALGMLFAIWGMRALTLLLANGREDFTLHPDLNWHVLGVAIALSLLTGVVFGLAPALQSTRVDVMAAMKETRAGQPGRRALWRLNLSHVLVVAQISFSLLMLVAAGLFVRTLTNLQSIELGFNRDNLLLFQMNARQAGHQDPEIAAFFGDLQTRFSQIPGVRYANMSHYPMIGNGSWFSTVIPAGEKPDKDEPGASQGTLIAGRSEASNILMIGPGFLTAMQIRVSAGREIDDRDRPNSPLVAVVNEVWAKTYFGDRNPLGQRVEIQFHKPPYPQVEIVGVARNARYGELTGSFPPVVYLPYNQGTYAPLEEMTYVLRTTGDPLRYVSTVREIVRQADPRVPVTQIKTEAAQVDQTMNQEIIFAQLCSAFAILALVIACVGLYGTVSYNVARRTGEIGIRMALGARRGNVVWMVLRGVLVLAIVALAISIPTALVTTKFVASFLYGMKPNDPAAMTAAVTILMSAALVAGFLPAQKASRIDPMVALRHE